MIINPPHVGKRVCSCQVWCNIHPLNYAAQTRMKSSIPILPMLIRHEETFIYIIYSVRHPLGQDPAVHSLKHNILSFLDMPVIFASVKLIRIYSFNVLAYRVFIASLICYPLALQSTTYTAPHSRTTYPTPSLSRRPLCI